MYLLKLYIMMALAQENVCPAFDSLNPIFYLVDTSENITANENK